MDRSWTYIMPLAFILAPATTTVAEDTVPSQLVIFANNGHDWYRIPSLAVTPNGTVLAFASRRKGSAGDFGHDTDVVLRRSTDHGRSFEPMQILVSKQGVDIHHGPVVIDRATGRIIKFCRCWPAKDNPQRFVKTTPYRRMVKLGYLDHFVVSDDDGRTWSDPRPLELPYPADAVSCGTGNGNHGIQLRDGRLLIQGGFVPRSGDHAGESHMCIFHSDDGGRTWQIARTLNHDYASYSDLAQSADGTIHCIYENGTKTYRDQITYVQFEID